MGQRLRRLRQALDRLDERTVLRVDERFRRWERSRPILTIAIPAASVGGSGFVLWFLTGTPWPLALLHGAISASIVPLTAIVRRRRERDGSIGP